MPSVCRLAAILAADVAGYSRLAQQASPHCGAWCLICRISAGVNRRLRRSLVGSLSFMRRRPSARARHIRARRRSRRGRPARQLARSPCRRRADADRVVFVPLLPCPPRQQMNSSAPPWRGSFLGIDESGDFSSPAAASRASIAVMVLPRVTNTSSRSCPIEPHVLNSYL
jgi:hypothetical protein